MTTLMPHPVGIPEPLPTSTSAPFWEACRRGELLYQRCDACGHAIFNPAPMCRWCHSTQLSWLQSTGVGEAYSWTVVWRPQTPVFNVPYVPAIIDVVEGYQMVSNIIGCEPEAISVGMRVSVEFHPIGGDVVLPYFRPI